MNNIFTNKKIKITRSYNVYDGPPLPYIDEEKKIIAFVADGSLLDCLEASDYDDWKSAVLDVYPITDAIEYALTHHKKGTFYKPKDDYDFDDYDPCVIGNFYFESDLQDEHPKPNKIVKFEIVTK